jgi:superfamily II DNA or RNA helicase
VDLLDKRAVPGVPDRTQDVSWLRDYQQAAVEAAITGVRGIIHAPTGCLAGDTIIEVNRAGKSFKIKLGDLVHRFNGGRITWAKGEPNREKGSGKRWDPTIPTMVRSRDADGFVRLHRLAGAASSGTKTTYTVKTASGHQLRATADHRFQTSVGWKRLHEMTIGDFVFVDAGLPARPDPTARKWYRLVNGLRSHPFAGRRGVAPEKGGYSVPMHRLVVEAGLNGLSYEDYVRRLREAKACPRGLHFLDPKVFAVHHIDGEVMNNAPDNLAVLPHVEHCEQHGREEGWRRLASTTAPTAVVAIERHGDEQTFDLMMEGEPHNFLANGIVVHNSGKTEIFAALARLLRIKWLFVVHRGTLVHQAAERFELRTGEKAGVIGEGTWSVERVTCATFQTLSARYKSGDPDCLDLLDSAQALMVDEGHTLPANSFWQIAMKTRQAYYRYAMSGTPLARGDKKSILTIAATGKTIYRIKPDVLIAAGVLAKPKIRLIPVVQTSDKPTWQGVYGECIVRSNKRNKAIVYATQRAAKPCMVFVKEITHGKQLKQMLAEAGMKSEFVWGTDSNERRMAAVTRLVRTDIDVLICSTIFNEGVDIPALASVVIASGGKSLIAAIQRVGRGMRTDGGRKTEFEVWDIADRGNKWLDRHTRWRFRAYAGEGYEVVTDELLGQQAAVL